MNARLKIVLVLLLPLLGLPLAGQEKDRPKVVTNSIGMELIRIDAGKFAMGSPNAEVQREDGEDVHEIEISKPFYIGKFEVTQAQYKAVMDKTPSRFQGDKLPVEMVSWMDAKEFCDKLSKKENKKYTLPTEAEWEYACRSGSKTPFFWGKGVTTDDGNYNGNKIYGGGKKGEYRKKTVEAGTFAPNKWGLHEMHGNVWEWCEDFYDENYYKNSPKTDPKGADKGEWRVLRGGSWDSAPEECRSAYRSGREPDSKENNIGFRVVLRD